MAWDYENIVRQLQESITVLTRMESRHDARLQDHHEWLETLQMAHEVERQRLAKWQQLHEQRMAKIDELLLGVGQALEAMGEKDEEREAEMALHKQRMARMDDLLLEIGEKLDALIHIVDGNIRGKQE